MHIEAQCPNCNSDDTTFKKYRTNASGERRMRMVCNSCSRWFTLAVQNVVEEEENEDVGIRRYVITACQNNTPINEEFVHALSKYCVAKDAELLVVPILYKPSDYDVLTYQIPEDIKYTLVTSKVRLHDELFVMGKFNFLPTTVNPLAGLESLSKGDTLIVPSPQLRMKSSAVSASRHPAILHTTGAISHPNYTNTKVGEKAAFNHVYAAVLVEVDSDNDYHIRVLKANDDSEFFDIGEHWTCRGFKGIVAPAALVTGDEHAMFSDPIVEATTYTNSDSIVNTLKPEYVIRHDVVDCYSISHHHRGDSIKSVGKHLFGLNSIEDELNETIAYINRTSEGHNFTNIIVPSNHSDHLTKWLTSVNIKDEPWNAKLYHKLMYHVLESLEESDSGISHDNPFEIYCKWDDVLTTPCQFLGSGESFKIADVELGQHGHQGRNGSRGTLNQFADMVDKYVIGHGHSPGVIGGAYMVGTSSLLKLEYTGGASSWAHVHCLVYGEGSRQLIRIVNGKWKA